MNALKSCGDIPVCPQAPRMFSSHLFTTVSSFPSHPWISALDMTTRILPSKRNLLMAVSRNRSKLATKFKDQEDTVSLGGTL